MSGTLFEELESQFTAYQQAENRAAGLGALATCEANGQARVRTVVLHEIKDNGVLLLVSRFHAKWSQFLAQPKAELLVWWPETMQQFRLAGTLVTQSNATAEALWQQLPVGAKKLDLAYGDSFIPGGAIFSHEQVAQGVTDRTRGKALDEKPGHVVAWRLEIEEIDRLLISPADRMHQQRTASLTDGTWQETQRIP